MLSSFHPWKYGKPQHLYMFKSSHICKYSEKLGDVKKLGDVHDIWTFVPSQRTDPPSFWQVDPPSLWRVEDANSLWILLDLG